MNTLLLKILGLLLAATSLLMPCDASAGRPFQIALGGGNEANETNESLVDHQLNKYIVGRGCSPLFGEVKSEKFYGGFVAKYNRRGKLLWGRQFNLPGHDVSITSIAANGPYIYLVGTRISTNGSCDQLPVQKGRVGFVSKLTAKNGIVLWTQTVEPANSTANRDNSNIVLSKIRFDSRHRGYIVGNTDAGISFAGRSSPQLGGGTNGFLLSMSNSGDALEDPIMLGGADSQAFVALNGLAIDRFDKLYVTGQSSVSQFGEPLTGSSDLLIAKAHTEGKIQWRWGKLHGLAGHASAGSGVAVDEKGWGYLAGTTQITEASTSVGGVLAFDTETGALKWSKWSSDHAGSGNMTDVAKDSMGNAVAVGYAAGVEAYPFQIKAALLKYSPAGDLLDHITFGSDTPGYQSWFSAVTHSHGVTYASGWSNFGLDELATSPPGSGSFAIVKSYKEPANIDKIVRDTTANVRIYLVNNSNDSHWFTFGDTPVLLNPAESYTVHGPAFSSGIYDVSADTGNVCRFAWSYFRTDTRQTKHYLWFDTHGSDVFHVAAYRGGYGWQEDGSVQFGNASHWDIYLAQFLLTSPSGNVWGWGDRLDMFDQTDPRNPFHKTIYQSQDQPANRQGIIIYFGGDKKSLPDAAKVTIP